MQTRKKSNQRNVSILQKFLEHPASVNETYLQHACFALSFSVALFLGAFAALIHAILPPLFQTTTRRIIYKLHERINNRS
ncbi:MAG: DUF6356 family protein [Amylibacter sp.]|nr:DUF6356 family protein [Amylibacter sp.]|tara:strand:+ start:205 stop:444 length:240 start_codon:yes stop_codon:yes gene_type:complete